MPKPLCIYHGNCADGFTAAWAVWLRLGDEVEFVPGIYGEAPPDVTGRDVIIVDFSYKRPVMDEMAKVSRTLLILDHHKTAQEDLKGLPKPGDHYAQWMDEATWDGSARYAALFDMTRSGAGLAWDFFHSKVSRPALVNYVEDRDLWNFHMPRSRDVNANIFSYTRDFSAWTDIADTLAGGDILDLFADEGAAIMRKQTRDIEELLKVCGRRMMIGGHDVPVANLPYTLTSEAGNLMAAEERFAACYWDTPTGRMFSLRSTNGVGEDVSEIAKAYGGGGHKHAAGFTMPLGWEGEKDIPTDGFTTAN